MIRAFQSEYSVIGFQNEGSTIILIPKGKQCTQYTHKERRDSMVQPCGHYNREVHRGPNNLSYLQSGFPRVELLNSMRRRSQAQYICRIVTRELRSQDRARYELAHLMSNLARVASQSQNTQWVHQGARYAILLWSERSTAMLNLDATTSRRPRGPSHLRLQCYSGTS